MKLGLTLYDKVLTLHRRQHGDSSCSHHQPHCQGCDLQMWSKTRQIKILSIPQPLHGCFNILQMFFSLKGFPFSNTWSLYLPLGMRFSTQSEYPLRQAMCTGSMPPAPRFRTLAPLETRVLVTEAWPWRAAVCRAVFPRLSSISTRAPEKQS